MGVGIFLLICVLTVLTVLFLNYPAPNFSKKLTQWQDRGKFLKYNNHDVFYIDEPGEKNDGSVLLCIHGFPTSGFDWSKILDDLKKQYGRIILPDMLGFGFSDKPKNESYLITEQANILESIVQSLSISEVHLLSHDYGDTVALELLHRHNSKSEKLKLKSVCMLNGGIFPETNFPRPVQKLLLVPYLGDFASRLTFYQLFKIGFKDIFGPKTQPSEEDLQDFYAVTRHKDGYIVNSRLIHYITQRDEHKERWVGALRKASVPVHMIYGPADPVNPPAFIGHYRKTVPSPSIDVLEEHIGHYPQWEAPDQVVKSYEQFLGKL